MVILKYVFIILLSFGFINAAYTQTIIRQQNMLNVINVYSVYEYDSGDDVKSCLKYITDFNDIGFLKNFHLIHYSLSKDSFVVNNGLGAQYLYEIKESKMCVSGFDDCGTCVKFKESIPLFDIKGKLPYNNEFLFTGTVSSIRDSLIKTVEGLISINVNNVSNLFSNDHDYKIIDTKYVLRFNTDSINAICGSETDSIVFCSSILVDREFKQLFGESVSKTIFSNGMKSYYKHRSLIYKLVKQMFVNNTIAPNNNKVKFIEIDRNKNDLYISNYLQDEGVFSLKLYDLDNNLIKQCEWSDCKGYNEYQISVLSGISFCIEFMVDNNTYLSNKW